MSEQQKALIEIRKNIRVNNNTITATKGSLIACEVNVKTYKRMLIKLDELHKVKMNNVQKEIDSYVESVKETNKVLEDLIAEKEALHVKLKEAIHHGEVLCEYCGKYFTSQGLARHKNTCSAKPANKIVEEHKAEIEEVTEDIEARKAALEKELAELKGIKK